MQDHWLRRWPGFRADRLNVLDLSRVNPDGDGLGVVTGSEIFLPHGGDARSAVDVGHIRHIGHIRDVGVLDVDHARLVDVGDVDLVNVGRAGGIPGVVSLARTEREPG
jgi:hypothetical protein